MTTTLANSRKIDLINLGLTNPQPLGATSVRKLREFFNGKLNTNFARIDQFKNYRDKTGKKPYKTFDSIEIQKLFGEVYNRIIDIDRKKLVEIKKEEKKNTPKNYKVTLFIERLYKEAYFDTASKQLHQAGDKIRFTQTEFVSTLKKDIPGFVLPYNSEDSYKVDTVLRYTSKQDISKKLKSVPERKQKMKRAFVVKNDWFRFKDGIARYAYDETNDCCVYYQLEKFLLDPPTGRPTAFINGKRTSKDSIYDYFNGSLTEEDDCFAEDMSSGVSAEMLEKLCKVIKRNMYGYNDENKVFSSVSQFDSKNYCPIVFYKYAGHFYIINDPKTIRSVGECNKANCRKVITSSVAEEEVEKDIYNIEVFHIDSFDVENAYDYKKGLYLLNQSNLNSEMQEFYRIHQHNIRTKNRENVVVQMKYENADDEEVILAVDTTYALMKPDESKSTYDMVKNVANSNGIKYVNEGIGSVILSLLNNMRKTEREYLNADEKKTLINLYNNKCAGCDMKCDKFELDHITPIGSGGSNHISNIQPLCVNCHSEKTKDENASGAYHVQEEAASSFNDIVRKNVIGTTYFKTVQFVERVSDFKGAKKVNEVIKTPVVCNVMDAVNPFSGKLKRGFFYVKGAKCFPFCENGGWYGESLIKYGLAKGLITEINIVYELIPSQKLSKDESKKQIEHIMKSFDGVLGKTKVEPPLPSNTESISEDSSDLGKIDMTKCRRNILLHYKKRFPVFNVMDSPKQFGGEVKCGFFYVETEQYFPFRGNGWYGESMVNYGLRKNLIVESDIKYELIPSKTLEKTHFKKHVEFLLEAFDVEPKLQKLSVNSLVGLFGKTKMTSSFSKYTIDPSEAAGWLDKYENHSVFIENTKLDENIMLYTDIFKQDVVAETSLLPIYKLVLEEEAIELHKLETSIIKSGSVILERNTDAILYSTEKKLKFTGFWDEEKTIPKYHADQPTTLVHNHPQYTRKTEMDFSAFELEWETTYDYENIDTLKTEIIDSNASIHIDGRAGCGKTYVVNKLKEELDKREMKYLCLSPTNKGARLIGGQTIHSLYYSFRLSKRNLEKKIENIKYIFVDEVSMMHVKFYKLFLMIKMMFPNIRYILSGDMEQLLPVKDEWTGDYKNSAALFSLCGGKRLDLTVCRRADDELYNLCKDVKTIDISRFEPTQITDINLAYQHKTRIRVNNECMERYLQNNKGVAIDIGRDIKNQKTQNIKLQKGMPVIAHTTNKTLNILNSDQFTVNYVDNEKIEIADGDRTITIKTKDFNKYFYLGFCITVHASQGATINKPYTIYDWNFIMMDSRAKYVAMSRSTDIHNIQIVE